MDRTDLTSALNKGIRFFKVIEDDNHIRAGEIVEFHHDDSSNTPAFYYPNKEQRELPLNSDRWGFISLTKLEPLTFRQQNKVITDIIIAERQEDKSQATTNANINTDTNSHYCIDGIQPIQYCQRCLTPEQFQGACIKDVIKYLSRFGKKDEKIREAEKALDYALWLYMSVAGKDVDPTKHNHEAIFKALEID